MKSDEPMAVCNVVDEKGLCMRKAIAKKEYITRRLGRWHHVKSIFYFCRRHAPEDAIFYGRGFGCLYTKKNRCPNKGTHVVKTKDSEAYYCKKHAPKEAVEIED